jgi:uncharacterized protein
VKVLITGATGLIGKKLTELLLKKGHFVNYLTTSKSKIITQENYKGFYWNIGSNEIDATCFEGVDTIVHLAGASIAKRWTKSYKKEILDSRILSSQLLFNTLQSINHQVKYVVSASGTAIYPETNNEVIDENCSKIENSFLADVVKKWEQSVSGFERLGISVAKIRTGVVFAKDEGAFPEMVKPIRFGFGAIMGNGNQMQSWIHITDIVNVYVFCIENQLSGVYNAVSPQPVCNRALTKEIAFKLRKLLWLPNVPEFIMKLVLGEMSYLLFNSKNISSQKIQDKGFVFHYPSLTTAIDTLL